jgi:aspartate-semialdehyde dehydrogenase
MMQSLLQNMGLGCKTLPLIKSPNCVTCGISVVLKAVDEAFGLEGVAVTTFQALSGRGDAKYDPALVVGNVYPLTGTEERTDEYQRSELMRIFPGITRCSVSAHRVPVQTGHFVDVKVQTRKKITSASAVKDVMRQFNPLNGLNLPSQPKMPIVVVDEPGRPRPLNDADYENGMAVAVGNIRTDDGFFDLTFSVVLNNVARGAWGAALINAEFYHLHVRPIIELKHDKDPQRRHLESISSGTCCIGETSQMGYHSELSTELDSSDSDKESMDEANRCVL